MSMYWTFDLGAVARRCLYLDAVSKTESPFETSLAIEKARASLTPRKWKEIPV
ncbi:MAG: hypothetical protein QM765_45740 [Myxococcales bacterium]